MTEFSRNIYSLPLPSTAELQAVSYDSPAHTGPFIGAIDLLVPVDTPVVAPLDGEVIMAVDGHTAYGPSADFTKKVNSICLQHENGEYSEYLHLAAGSLLVHKGVAIEAGQPLARTGLSGWMDEPHLHWFIFRRTTVIPGFTGLTPRLTRSAQELIARFTKNKEY